MKVYIDGKLVLTDENYSGFISQAKESIKFKDETMKLNYKVTDFNIWNDTKSENFLKSFSTCQTVEEGNILKWSSTNFDQYQTEEDNICSNMEAIEVLAFEGQIDFDKTTKFCSKLGGKMAVARNETMLMKMKSSVKAIESCDEFYIGYSDRAHEGNWVDVNDKSPMMFKNWAEDEPDNFAVVDQDCAISLDGSKFKDTWCSKENCPICEIYTPKIFQINDGDEKPLVADKFEKYNEMCELKIDTHYTMVNQSYFIGFMFTYITKSTERWEIRSMGNNAVLAWTLIQYANIPLGSLEWDSQCCSSNSICLPLNSPGKMNLHLKVEQPGNYFCPGGEIIDSSAMCDGKSDCEDGFDERKEPGDVNEKGCLGRMDGGHSIGFDYQVSFEDLFVNASVYVLDVLDISQDKSTFTLFFWLRLEWFYSYDFYFLNENYKQNKVDEMTDIIDVWKPNITFLHLDDNPLTTFEESYYVLRKASPKVYPSSMNMVYRYKEYYTGNENPFIKDALHQAEFSCSFDNIRNYPFGKQNCSFNFFLIKTPSKLRAGKIHYQGNTQIGQYVIDEDRWSIECGTEVDIEIQGCNDCEAISPCKVTVRMQRDIFSALIVSFLPSLLMNCINQASVYVSGDSKYDLIFTINITIMMVLASIYLSISTSLPSTPTTKPVEQWLLFNLIYPFLVIIINVVLQVNFHEKFTIENFVILYYSEERG